MKITSRGLILKRLDDVRDFKGEICPLADWRETLVRFAQHMAYIAMRPVIDARAFNVPFSVERARIEGVYDTPATHFIPMAVTGDGLA